MTVHTAPEETLTAIAQGDAPVLETIAQMNLNTLDRSGLPEQTYHLVRIAALVAMDAAPMSYLMNLGMAQGAGVTLEQVQGVFTAIAPVVGGARITAGAGNSLRALGFAVAVADEAESPSIPKQK